MNIIQLGCNNGQDHVYDFIFSYPSVIDNVLLVDASRDSIELCKKQYKEFEFCEFLHSAVVADYSKYITIYYPEQDTTSGHASSSIDFLTKHNHHKILEMIVPAININNLFQNFNKSIDRLYIDTEGSDIEIINAIDMNKHIIPFIFFEYTHSDGAFMSGKKLEECIQRLEFYKYKIYQADNNNLIAIL